MSRLGCKCGAILGTSDYPSPYSLEIFYAMTADAKDEMVFAPEGNEELRQFLEQAGYTRSDRIICLSTCAGDASTTRTVVFAYILEN